MSADERKKASIIKAILKRRYPDFLKWQKPVHFLGVGPHHPTVFDAYAANVQATIEYAQKGLATFSLEQLEESYDHTGWPISPGSKSAERILRVEINALRATEPVWFAGGFNVEGHEADFKYWTRMKRWSLFETVAVSIGFEPYGDILEDADGRRCQTEVVEFYQKRLALIKDNFNWSAPQWEGRQEVDELCIWLRDIDLDVPPGLLEEAGQRFGWKISKTKTTKRQAKPSDLREHKTMLRLIIGLAIGGYGYNPKATRSTIPKEISDDFDRLGMSLDPDTIRKYLREGHDLLPQDFFDDDTTSAKKE